MVCGNLDRRFGCVSGFASVGDISGENCEVILVFIVNDKARQSFDHLDTDIVATSQVLDESQSKRIDCATANVVSKCSWIGLSSKCLDLTWVDIDRHSCSVSDIRVTVKADLCLDSPLADLAIVCRGDDNRVCFTFKSYKAR